MLKTMSPPFQVLFFIGMVLAMSILGELIYGLSLSLAIDPSTLDKIDWQDPKITLSRALFGQVFMFLLAFMLFLKWSGERFSSIVYIKKIAIKPLLYTLSALAICFLVLPLIEYLNAPLRAILPAHVLESEMATNALQEKIVYTDNPIQFGVSLIVMGLLPAICEELVFRGFLIKKMVQSGMKEHAALVLSALIFSLSHGQPLKVLAIFVLGLTLGHVYLKFKNLKYAILLHFSFNSIQILIGFLVASGVI